MDSSRSSRRAASTTLAPRCAKATAVASPMPADAPVTTATAPFNCIPLPTLDCMDVIEAHVAPTPARWTSGGACGRTPATELAPRRCSRAAWPARRPIRSTTSAGNIAMLHRGRPRQGVRARGLPGALSRSRTSWTWWPRAPACRSTARPGTAPSRSRPSRSWRRARRWGTGSRRAADRGERVVLATGHPVGLALFYRALDRLLRDRGADVLRPRARRALARRAPLARLVHRSLGRAWRC